MPSSVTHAYFSIDLYERLSTHKRNLLKAHKDHLRTFAQGPDVFFFYKLICPKSGKNIRSFGHYTQKNDTQKFFVNLVTEIKKRKLNKNPEALAFLYGFISHYVLDMTIHPYVVYKEGIFNKNDKSTYKYAGGHSKLEVYFDAYLIQVREKIRPYSLKTHNFCFPATTFSKQLESIIDDVFDKTFNKEKMGAIYQESIKHAKAVFKLIRNDRIGIKNCFYDLINTLPLPISLKIKGVSYHIKLDKNSYYLNLSKDIWNHPVDKNLLYNYSIIELYSIALNKAVKLINEVDKVLSSKYDLEYLKILFPNLSYVTGLDCKLGNGTYFSY